MTEPVRYSTDFGVARIVLATPDSGNAIGSSLLAGLKQSIGRASNDDSCRVVVISADGSDFCKGLDLEEFCKEEQEPDPSLLKTFVDCLTLICDSSRPVIAQVEGNVTGGGVALVAACDLVLADENVVFMLPEPIVGMIPALATPFLLRRLTLAQIRYMTLSSRQISAWEAKVVGLVDQVAKGGMETVLNEQLRRLLCSSPDALAESKRYFDRLCSEDMARQCDIALDEILSWLKQPKVVEGIRTFSEGLTPPWFQRHGRNKKWPTLP